MVAQLDPYPDTVHKQSNEDLSGSLLTQKLLELKQEQVSGTLTLRSKRERWTLYLYLGRLLYAEGGENSLRRWYSHVTRVFPGLDQELEHISLPRLQADFPGGHACRQYQVICLLAKRGLLGREQTQTLIRTLCSEVLVDITAASQVRLHLEQDESISPRLSILNLSDLLDTAQIQITNWQATTLDTAYFNQIPRLEQPDLLQTQVSAPIFAQWQKIFEHQRTLREIALSLGRDPLDMGRLLLPLLHQGIVTMQPAPNPLLPLFAEPPTLIDDLTSRPLIVCIDDSEIICEGMKKIVSNAGYRFLGILDPLRAIAQVLSQPPDIIFLDLVMPLTNGYEICAQLRKIARFRDTPIIILTGNDGIIDRVRAKLVGSTHFMSKPVQKTELLEVIETYLTVGETSS
ncbi:MAG: response regulator [Cyanobacteriota bacterium]|nr:response regulator [Cyanobacteriota bacterium]